MLPSFRCFRYSFSFPWSHSSVGSAVFTLLPCFKVLPSSPSFHVLPLFLSVPLLHCFQCSQCHVFPVFSGSVFLTRRCAVVVGPLTEALNPLYSRLYHVWPELPKKLGYVKRMSMCMWMSDKHWLSSSPDHCWCIRRSLASGLPRRPSFLVFSQFLCVYCF